MRILLISYFVAPLQKIGSVRWTKISKYLKRKYDVEIDVLTMEKDFDLDSPLYSIEKKDALLEKDMWCFDNYTTLKYGPFASAYRRMFYLIRNRSKRGTAYAVRTSDSRDGTETAQPLVGMARKHRRSETVQMIKNRLQLSLQAGKESLQAADSIHQCSKYIASRAWDYDIVISSYSPMWTHIVARKAKEINPQILWIADFRDAYATDLLSPHEFNKRKTFCASFFTKADIVTKVLDEMELYLSPQVTEYTLTNGYDPEEALPPEKPERFNFVYTGSLYGEKRDLRPLFQALSELQKEGRIKLDDVSVDYAGVHHTAILGMAADYDLQRFVVNHGVISRAEALKLQTTCALLLLADWNTALNKPCWSGKAYEYMMAKKPIVFIMSGDVPDSLPSRYVPRLGGTCFERAREMETMETMKQFIADQYRCWKETGDVFLHRDENYAEQYSYEKIADRLWSIINQHDE